MANKIKLIAASLFVALVFTGCKNKSLAPEAYFSYFEKHRDDLRKTRELEVLNFEASYVPADVMAARDIGADDHSFNASAFANAYKSYSSSWYFSFKIRPSESTGSLKKLIRTKENYSQIKQYLASQIKSDFSIEVNSKEIECDLIDVESDLTMRDCFLFIMSFDKAKASGIDLKDITLVYKDNLFQNGILKFQFSGDQINNFPKIKAS